MGVLYPVRVCKDKVLEKILTSQEVVDLIADDKYTEAPAFGLMYRKVYPYACVPDTIDTASTIVCVEGNIADVHSDTVCDIELTILVMSHIGVMKTDFGTRVDAVADAIDDLINHSRDFGIGKVTLIDHYPTSWSLPNYDYVCRKMIYLIKDFNFRYGAGNYG